MSKISKTIVEKRKIILILAIISVIISLIGLQTLEFSSGQSSEALPSDIEAIENQEILQNSFGSGDTVMVSIEISDYSKTSNILDPEVIKATHRFTQNVENKEFVTSTSSYATPIYRNLGRAPQTTEEAKQVIRNYPQIQGSISQDQTTSLINVKVNTESGLSNLQRVMDEIDQSITNAGFPSGVEATQTGGTAIIYRILTLLQSDLSKMLLLALVFVFLSMVLLYRGITRAVVPIIPLILGVILTIGLLSLSGMDINPATVSVGAMLVGMGIDYGVHVYNRYYEERKKGKNPEESAMISIDGVGKAIIGTSATTIAGFASLYVSKITFMKDLSISLVLGIALTMIFALGFLPIVIIFEEEIRKKITGHYETTTLSIHTGRINRFFKNTSSIVNNHYKKIIIVFVLVTLVMGYGATKTKMETSMEEMLPEDMKVINALEAIRNKLGGEDTVSVLIKSKNGADVRDSELLRKTRAMQELMKSKSYTTKITSVNSITNIFGQNIPNNNKKIKETLNQNPRTNQYINDDYSVLRVTLEGNIEEDTQTNTQENLKNIEETLNQITLPKNYEASIGGSLVLNDKMNQIASEDMNLISITGFIGIIIVVLLLFRSLTDGIIMATPMAIGAIWTFGFVGYSGMTINQFLIGFLSMILGLGIDFGMHITHRFKEAKQIQETLTSVGPGILAASATTIIGYLALLTGSLPIVRDLGIILTVGIASSTFTAFLLTPSLIKLRKRIGGKTHE